MWSCTEMPFAVAEIMRRRFGETIFRSGLWLLAKHDRHLNG
jgi:hypothetical protein